MQGASSFYTDFDAVPDRAAIATVTGYWPQLGDEQIAEWVVAAIFENQYRLAQRAEAFRACAFASDAPSKCASDSGATNHTMVSDLTVGVLGYGNIGVAVARRAAALGATVVATKPERSVRAAAGAAQVAVKRQRPAVPRGGRDRRHRPRVEMHLVADADGASRPHQVLTARPAPHLARPDARRRVHRARQRRAHRDVLPLSHLASLGGVVLMVLTARPALRAVVWDEEVLTAWRPGGTLAGTTSILEWCELRSRWASTAGRRRRRSRRCRT